MHHDKIVILTGAGISAESGIQTFRASDGLWENHRVEDVATPQAYVKNPVLVHEFYNQRRQQLQLPSIKPNAAHVALATLQATLSVNKVIIVTQNIDNLHERAGASVLHMHGELLQVYCLHCHQVSDWNFKCDLLSMCPNCAQQGQLRPNIVWFGEMPHYMQEIDQHLQQASVFVSIGTSGAVYPAAGFVSIAKQNNAKTIEINLEPSANASLFDEGYYGPATIEVPRWVDVMLA